MNKLLYRIIFNKARGMLMATAEIAASHSHTSTRPKRRPLVLAHTTSFNVHPLVSAVLFTLGNSVAFIPYAQAQVVADPNAAANLRPQIFNAANGVPLINIQTPSAAGVSRNVYRQLDVQSNGAILNNARNNAQTQLGGWVQGNPNLASGTARVILNEVNSNNSSQLRGFIEVAGDRAQVVIANPAGITCDGCGFINANRATLTTGTPIMNGGNLEGYRVAGGQITIQGNGLDATQTDYTDLIARAVEVNTGLWANNLSVTTGANQVAADNSVASPITGSSPAPAFAVDVAGLGGMYAGKIHLVGTEAGVGVRNAGTIGASAGEVRITVDGQLLNSGSVTSTDTTAITVTHLTNRGLIDGTHTRLAATTLDNLGSGRLYGDQLSIAATTLNNTVEAGSSPTIAARNRLDLGVGSLNNDNGALIFSSGDLAIGGNLDTSDIASGRAGTLTNNGGTLQALGAMQVTADQIINTNANFSAVAELAATPVSRTTYYTSQGSITEDQIASKSDAGAWGNLLSGNNTPNAAGNSTISFVLNPTDTNPNPVNTGPLTVYSFLSESYQPLVARVISSVPGQILSSGNMALDASTTLTNDKSRIIAGGALNILGQSVTNIAAQVSGTEYHSGTSRSWGYAGHDGKSTGHGCDCDTYAFLPSAYAANIPRIIDAQITAAAGGQTVTGGSNPSLPDSSLYHVNPSSVSRYLIETDPRFANYRNWLSADYLQRALTLDPSVTQKRLGDGFYEQRQIQEQIAQLTGRRFLDGYANEEAQYQALMDAGITQARAFNLRLGIALTASQIAQLTSDIVWLVEQTVTLPDGSTQKVLVPQLYLMPRAGDLAADGTLIAGQTVHIAATGDVTNSGTVAGRQLLQINATNIANLAGRITADQVDLQAQQDLINRGGQIVAKDELTLSAGRDLSLETSTATGQGETDNGRFSRTQIDRIAGLYVTGSAGTLTAIAGRNLTLTGAEIINTGHGTTQLAAIGDVVLDTVTTRDLIDISGQGNTVQITASTEVGSRIRTSGELSLLAGNDLSGRAIDVQAQGDVTLNAGRDLTLSAGRNKQSVEIGSHSTNKTGGGIKRKTITRDFQTSAETDHALTGTLTGKNINLQANQDITLEGGAYLAQGTLALAAGRDLTLAAGESTASEQQKRQISSKEQFGFGTQSLKTTRDETAVTPEVAQLSGRQISLTSGSNLTLIAPQVKATTLTAQAGGQLTLAAATATHNLKETSEYKSNRFNFSEVTNPRVTGARIKDKVKLAASTGERRAIVTEIDAQDIALQSLGDTLLVAPRIKATTLSIEVGSNSGEMTNPNAQIQFLGVKENTTQSNSKNSHSFVHETVRDGGSNTETLKLPDIQSRIETPTQLTLVAPGGIVVGATNLSPTQQELKQGNASSSASAIPTSNLIRIDLQTQAQSLAQQPGLAWLGELAQRNDVDWQKIELATQNWDYKHAGLTQEGAAVVAIVVAIVTWGAASGVGTAVAEGAGMTTAAGTAGASTVAVAGTTGTVLTTTGAAVAAATAAGLTTLASQAAVSLINNQGDVGKTLQDLGSKDSVKQLVASMLTAGVTSGVTSGVSSALNLPTGAALSKASFTTRFATYATKAAISAGVQSAVYGTPLSETAKTALVNSLAQTLTSEIGDWGKSDPALVAKTLAHAVVQCAAASVQGNDCGSAALGAATAEILSPLLDSVDASTKAAGFQQSLGASIAGMGAMLAASLTGKDPITAMNAAQMVDNYNRQLHPDEAKLIAARAQEYADKRGGISIQQAVAELTQQAEQNSDSAWDTRLGSDNPAAQAFLTEIGLGKTMVDPMTGQTYQLFTADAAQRDNHAMFAQYSKSNPLVKAELDLAMNKAYLPNDAQNLEPKYQTGSDLALNDAARDYGNMRNQPAVVQQTVLAELRVTRLDIAQQEKALLEQFKALPLTPENRDLRADLQNQIDHLETRDFFLLKATQAQILDMGSVGLLNPLSQKETIEGFGDALGGARLSGKGVSATSVNGRINMLKGVIAEAQAEAKAIAQAKIENNIARDGEMYFAKTYTDLKNTTTNARTQLGDAGLDASGKPVGNVAAAEINVYGKPSEMVQASSRVGNDASSAKDGFVSLPPDEQRILKPEQFPKDPIPRQFDTEYKILENFAQKNIGNPNVQGNINLYTERAPCYSCTKVIEQKFTELFPNMEVRVYHGNGEITLYKGNQIQTMTVPSKNTEDWPTVPGGEVVPPRKTGSN